MRKLLLSLPAVLACTLSPAQATVYQVDKVDVLDGSNSVLFYDAGKGHALQENGAVYAGAVKLYNETGSFAYLGDLAGRVNAPNTAISSNSFKYLAKDNNACWVHVSANMLQYWLGYYGVFYQNGSTSALPYGYTYDTKYLADMGGALSLDVGVFLLDNMENQPGNLVDATDWFLKGTPTAPLREDNPDSAGFFAAEFTGDTRTIYYYDNAGGADSRPGTLDALTPDLFEGLGIDSATGEVTTPGQLLYLSIKDPNGSGHAVTCYGFETDSTGKVCKLYVCNSDDSRYGMSPVYLREEVVDGVPRIYLYADPEFKTCYGNSATKKWYLDKICFINTPDSLKTQYATYSAADNPLVWTGEKPDRTWSETDGLVADHLPTMADGWAVEVDGTYHPSFYDEGRPVEIGDMAVRRSGTSYVANVHIDGTVSTPNLILSGTRTNGASNLFHITGKDSAAAIVADVLTASGSGANYWFHSVRLSVGGVHEGVNRMWLCFADGSTLESPNALTFRTSGVALYNTTVDAPQVSIGSSAVCEFKWTNTLTGNLVFEDKSSVNLYLTDAPLFAVGGALSVRGDTSVYIYDAQEDHTYIIGTFGDFEGDVSHLKLQYYSKPYRWIVADGTLQLCLGNVASIFFPAAGHVWQDGVAGFENKQTPEVRFSGGVYTVIGTVTPAAVYVSGAEDTVWNDGGKGCVSGMAQLNKTDSGTLTINTANTYKGGTVLAGGHTVAGNAQAFGTGSIRLNGGDLDMGGFVIYNNIIVNGDAVISGGKNFNGTLTLNSGNVRGDTIHLVRDATLNSGSVKNYLNGTGGIIKEGSGTVILGGMNSYTGGTVIENGTLIVETSRALGGGAVKLKGGVLDVTGVGTLTATALTLNGGTLKLNPGSISLSGTLTIQGLTSIDVGSLDVGTYTVLNGTNITGTLGMLDLVGVNNPCTWDWVDHALVLHINPVTPMNPSLVIAADNKDNLISKKPLTGDAVIEMNGTGTLTLSVASDFTGGTTINNGAVIAAADGALGSGAVTLNKGVLAVNGFNLSGNELRVRETSSVVCGEKGSMASINMAVPGILDKDGTLLFGGVLEVAGSLKVATLNIGAGNVFGGAVEVRDAIKIEAGSVSTDLSGSASFTKSGRGTAVLMGHNSWTGATTVNGGRLVIIGSTSLTSLTINSGGLTIAGDGSLTVTGVLRLPNSATMDFSGIANGVKIAPGSLDESLIAFFATNGYAISSSSSYLDFTPKGSLTGGDAADTPELPVIVAPAPAAAISSLAQGTWGAARAAHLFTQSVADHEGAGSVALDATGTRSAWFSTVGGFARTSSHGVAGGADADILGGALGMQFNGSKGGNIGLAIGQTWGRISPMDGGASVTQNAQHAALYGSKTLVNREHDRVGVSATVAWSTTDSDTTQNGHGFDWTQQGAVLGLRGTWEHAVSGASSVYGFLGTEYLATNSGSTENGQSGSVQDWKVELGAGARHTAGKLTVYADAAFAPSLVRHNPVAESDGTRGGASNPGRLEIHANAGAAYQLNEHWNLHAGYSYEGAARENSHNLRAGAVYTF